MTDIVDLLSDLRERFVFQGGSKFALGVADTIKGLRLELETERMRLAACGVVALADTPESAANARTMKDEYRSDSCDAVAMRVDECMRLRTELAEARDKAIRFDLDRDSIEAQEKEAIELVELRAQNATLRSILEKVMPPGMVQAICDSKGETR